MIKLKAIADCSIQLEKARLDASSEVLFGILVHLIVERGRSVPRSSLAEFFWWNSDKRDASHCLRQVVYKLRKMGAPIETSGDSYALPDRSAIADFDCADERTLALSPLAAEDAVAVFPGYAPEASASFLTWLERTREKAGRAIRAVIVPALGEARRRNGWEEAAKLARQCLVLDPLNEEATLTLAEFTALRGDKREALRMIDGYIEEMSGTYADLRLPASLLRNRISERVAHPPASVAGKIALVGREDSLALLATVAAQLSGGAGHTCVIDGAPGIGKTRLLTEFANISAMKGARIVRVDCRADAVERPLGLIMELAPQLLRMPGALGCSPAALRLVRRLGSYDPNERLDPDEYGGADFLHSAVRASLRDLVDAVAGERPLYLLIEDVHWIDRPSLDVLKELIGSNRGRQLLVIMTTRTLGDGELLHGIDRRQIVVHSIPRLGEQVSRALARSVCVALEIPDDDDVIAWCAERSDGIPLYLTELLAHWRETGDRNRVPPSLEGLIDERVGVVEMPALYAMQAIALLDGEGTTSVLEAVLGMPRWQVVGCVEELEKSGLVICSADRIASRHSLLADAALQKMGPSAALMLHRAIASYLTAELEGGATDPQLTWRAARHWNAAGATGTALDLVTAAARHLASIGAVFEAAALLKRSLTLSASNHDRLQLLNERRGYLISCGLSEELRENSQWAMELEAETSPDGQRVHSENEISFLHACLDRRRVDGVVEHALSCIRYETATVAHRLAAATAGMVAAYAESSKDAAHRVVTAAAHLIPTADAERLQWVKTKLIFEYEFGDLRRATELADELLDLARARSVGRLSNALIVSSFPHRILGNFHIVDGRVREALSLARQQGHPADESQALLWLALDAADRLDYSEAERLSLSLLKVLERCPTASTPPMHYSVATIFVMTGQDALALSQLALDNEPLVLHGRSDQLAARIFAEAMQGRSSDPNRVSELMLLNEQLQERPGQERATISLALALHRQGRLDAAVQLVTRYVHNTRREQWQSRDPVLRSFAAGRPVTDPRDIRAAACVSVHCDGIADSGPEHVMSEVREPRSALGRTGDANSDSTDGYEAERSSTQADCRTGTAPASAVSTFAETAALSRPKNTPSRTAPHTSGSNWAPDIAASSART